MSRGEGLDSADFAVGMSAEWPVEVRVLGGFEVIAAGRPISRADWQRVSAERLVKLLLVTPGHRVSREVAGETLWPDADPESSRANVRKALHFANRALQDTGLLVSDGGAIGLANDRLRLDLDRLGAAIAEVASAPGGGGAADRCGDAIEVVVDLAARDLLPDDSYEDWLIGPRERLRDLWQRTALPLAQRAFELGRWDHALELVTRVLDRDPTDEAAHRLAIELYAARGRHHAVRRQLELCRRALREEVDAEPSPETLAVFRLAESTAARVASEVPPPARRLVGRRSEIELVEPLLDRVAAGHPSVLVSTGPAGIGKTRLLEELTGYVHPAGWRVLRRQGSEQTRWIPYAPFRLGLAGVLSEEEVATWDEPARSGIASVAPGLGVPQLQFHDAAALETALLAALLRLSRATPLFVALDDVPLLDAASLRVLRTVPSALARSRILVAATLRDDEPLSEAVRSLADDARHAGGLVLSIGPLGRHDVENLVTEHLGGETVAATLARRLYDECAGNPLFCLERARILRERGAVAVDGGRWVETASTVPDDLPPSVRSLVDARLRALPMDPRRLLAVAAELDPPIGYATLCAVLGGQAPMILGAIDTALGSGLLVECNGGYAFGHPLYRAAVREAGGQVRRGSIHTELALELAGVAPEASVSELRQAARTRRDPVPIALHALTAVELGQDSVAPLALVFGLCAAEVQQGLFDRASATSILERALAAARRLPRNVAQRYGASTALTRLGDLQYTAGDDRAATATMREAIAEARTPGEIAAAYAAFQWIPYHHGDFPATMAILHEGIARLPADARVAIAGLRCFLGWAVARLGRCEDALELLADATIVLEASGERRETMRALDLFGDVLGMLGRHGPAIEALGRSLALALELGDSHGELLARLHLGSTLNRDGRPGQARPHLERAVELARLTGDRYVESVAVWKAAEMLDALDDTAGAADMRRHEIALLEAMGGNPHHEALARALATRSASPGYAARIEAALAGDRWSDLGS